MCIYIYMYNRDLYWDYIFLSSLQRTGKLALESIEFGGVGCPTLELSVLAAEPYSPELKR